MNKLLRFLCILGAVGLFFSPFALSTPEIAKKEKQACLACHTAVGKAELNEAGKYYKEHGVLPKKK